VSVNTPCLRRFGLPEEIRQLVPLQPGQDVLILARGGAITLVPERPVRAHDRASARAPTLAELAAAQDVKPADSVEETRRRPGALAGLDRELPGDRRGGAGAGRLRRTSLDMALDHSRERCVGKCSVFSG